MPPPGPEQSNKTLCHPERGACAESKDPEDASAAQPMRSIFTAPPNKKRRAIARRPISASIRVHPRQNLPDILAPSFQILFDLRHELVGHRAIDHSMVV